MTLPRALQLARSQPAALQAAALLTARTHLRDAARHRYLPTIMLSVDDNLGFRSRSEAALTSSLSDLALSARATIAARVFDFGLRSAELSAAESSRDAQEHNANSIRLELELTVATLYATALADLELLATYERELADRAEVVTGIEALIGQGLRPRIDQTRANAELLRAQVSADIYRLRSAEGRRVLGLQLGMGPHHDTMGLAALPELSVCATEVEIAEAAARIAAEHPQLHAARAQVNAALASERAADAAKLPTLDLTILASFGRSDLVGGSNEAFWGRYGGRQDLYTISAGLVLQWQALDLTVWDRSAAAEAQTGAEREDLRRQTILREIESVQTAKQAREAALVLRRAQELDELSELSLAAEIERYQRGEGSLLQLLDAQRSRRESKLARVDARLARDVACLRLQLQSGGFTFRVPQ